nr:META domain-containing protein [uncultured Flavobacterium sp.]
MKKILMFLIVVSFVSSCKTTNTTAINEKPVPKKLQQTWILESLNGKTITTNDFSNFPKIIISTSTFSGSTGCNSIKGNLLSKGNGQIQFLNLTAETKKCNAKKESDFKNLLKTTSGYSAENEKLVLSNQFGPIMTFKKG